MNRITLSLYRIRSVLSACGVGILIAIAVFGRLVPSAFAWIVLALAAVAVLMMIVAIVLVVVGPRALPQHPTVVVHAPVAGRWLAMNSPATKVPSHGVRAYGQAFAIDLVSEPVEGSRPVFGDGPAMRPPTDYPAFGQPVLAMIDGEVVAASGWRRDHRARSDMPAMLYMSFEGMVRELGGPGFIIGNHVTIKGADGVFATVAHLQRGSLAVKAGDRVLAGQQIGGCGNSGNTTEPHVHAQLMDRRSPITGQGIPIAFRDIVIENSAAPADELIRDGLPADGEHLIAGPRSH